MTAFSSLSDDSLASTIVPTVVAITSGVIAYCVLSSIYRKKAGKGSPGGPINQKIDKDKAKVVHCFDIEDLPNNVSYCRCWKSKKFPYCDGSHNAHNTLTGDNVGPLCLKRSLKE
eukprot:Seg817.4 transcript_id=Seg817.4/GoldUCD/mRNA.D3Y31 product="CDGSH iron-sulfur domain-containing protein 1" protein_id=Seg817.4/GoldUCD/D3Y31